MIKNWFKLLLQYRPRHETSDVREFLEKLRETDRPYCPSWEGDLIWSLISQNRYLHCLQTGFGTGSTALYMLHALQASGEVVSVDISPSNFNDVGQENLRNYGIESRHSLIEEPSQSVLPRFFLERRSFDFIFIDGWKTFDHLAVEIYFANQLLTDRGAIMFDDANMASVHKAINLLRSHYNYTEIDYVEHKQDWRLRLFHILTNRNFRRPYRAFVKSLPTHQQSAFSDYRFFRDF